MLALVLAACAGGHGAPAEAASAAVAGTSPGDVTSLGTVQVESGGSAVLIATPGPPPSTVRLALRDGLLPEVHHLPDGRHVLLSTRDGWLLRVDLAQQRLVAQVRVGQLVRDAALSGARPAMPAVLAVALDEPRAIAFVDERLTLIRLMRVTDRSGRLTSRVGAIRSAVARESFVLSLRDLPELWEISYNPTAPEIAQGMVHDFQYREGAFVPGYLNPQRTTLPAPATEFWLAPGGHEVFTVHPDKTPPDANACMRLRVTHLDTRRKVSERMLPGQPGCSEIRDQ